MTYLLRVYRSPANTDFYQTAGFYRNLEEVSAARSHGLVAHDRLEGVPVANSHRDGPRVLIDKLLLVPRLLLISTIDQAFIVIYLL